MLFLDATATDDDDDDEDDDVELGHNDESTPLPLLLVYCDKKKMSKDDMIGGEDNLYFEVFKNVHVVRCLGCCLRNVYF